MCISFGFCNLCHVAYLPQLFAGAVKRPTRCFCLLQLPKHPISVYLCLQRVLLLRICVVVLYLLALFVSSCFLSIAVLFMFELFGSAFYLDKASLIKASFSFNASSKRQTWSVMLFKLAATTRCPCHVCQLLLLCTPSSHYLPNLLCAARQFHKHAFWLHTPKHLFG